MSDDFYPESEGQHEREQDKEWDFRAWRTAADRAQESLNAVWSRHHDGIGRGQA